MEQPTLFERKAGGDRAEIERVVLFAIGEFQARGKTLANRELPLDRLRGALRRATDAAGLEELDDETAVSAFALLGATVRRVPPFVAKHPYRVIVPGDLAERGLTFYRESTGGAGADDT